MMMIRVEPLTICFVIISVFQNSDNKKFIIDICSLALSPGPGGLRQSLPNPLPDLRMILSLSRSCSALVSFLCLSFFLSVLLSCFRFKILPASLLLPSSCLLRGPISVQTSIAPICFMIKFQDNKIPLYHMGPSI
jgi:hypothetical protein